MMLLRGRWVERRRQARIRFDAMQCNASDGEAMGVGTHWGLRWSYLLAQARAGRARSRTGRYLPMRYVCVELREVQTNRQGVLLG